MKNFYGYNRNKYKNRQSIVDGIKFSSYKESQRYLELKIMQKCGDISNLKIQPRFELMPSFVYQGQVQRKIEYVADFSYTTKKGEKVVEDVKSKITKRLPVYRIKKKLLLFCYKDFIFLET